MTRRQWLLVALTAAGVAAVSASYYLLNGPPPAGRWPAFWAWDPRGHELVGAGESPEYHAFVLKSWLDEKIPYLPILAVPYLSFLVLIPVAVPALLLRMGELRQFFSYGVALIVSQLALDVAYLLFQTTVPREPEAPSRLDGLVDLIRSNDQPFNGFPSGHVAWTTIAIVALWRLRRRLPRTVGLGIAWLVLIYPATVALRQHYLIDVYAGLFVGFACYWACMFAVERPVLTPRRATL